jgi:hypothetical protein
MSTIHRSSRNSLCGPMRTCKSPSRSKRITA